MVRWRGGVADGGILGIGIKKRSVGFGAGLDQDSEVSPLLQVTLTFSRAPISGALRRAVSKPSQIPPRVSWVFKNKKSLVPLP